MTIAEGHALPVVVTEAGGFGRPGNLVVNSFFMVAIDGFPW
jgi:hypothetical protein